MSKESKKGRMCFIGAVSKILDEHADGDKEKREALEKFLFDVLCVVDGCCDIEHPVFLSVGAYEDDIVSGNLHGYFVQFRRHMAPIIRLKMERKLTENVN